MVEKHYLKEVLKATKNNRNHQYAFIIRKKAMIKLGLCPDDILVLEIKNKNEKKTDSG